MSRSFALRCTISTMLLVGAVLSLLSIRSTANSDFQSRADAVTNIMDDYLCDLQHNFAIAHKSIRDEATDRIRRLDRLAAAYPADDRRVPWMLDQCQSLVDRNIMWTHRQQQLAVLRVLNETQLAQHSVRDRIGYFVHLDDVLPDALADWRRLFEQTVQQLHSIGWESNNDTAAYHATVFGQLSTLNRRQIQLSGALNRTSSNAEDPQIRSEYAGTWKSLVKNSAAEMHSTYDRFGGLLSSYAIRLRDVGSVIVKRLRKLNVINEKCFCY